MGDASLWSHRTVLVADLSNVAQARQFVEERLLEHHLTFLAEDVVLAASELATIAISDAPGQITLTLVGVEDAVVLTVRHGPLRNAPREPGGWPR
jgi:anti-sigma regulatory factor (Ser/Thr protein kinase)